MFSFAHSLALLASLLTQPFVEGQCGADRWAVKIAADLDAASIGDAVVDATVEALGRIPIPEIPYPHNRRIAPQELTRYRVVGIMVRRMQEQDGDLHVVLRDPDSSATMIIEAPRDDCGQRSRFRRDILGARTALQSLPLNSRVRVVGIGFFDFIHSTLGAAPNGFELHPVVNVMPD